VIGYKLKVDVLNCRILC